MSELDEPGTIRRRQRIRVAIRLIALVMACGAAVVMRSDGALQIVGLPGVPFASALGTCLLALSLALATWEGRAASVGEKLGALAVLVLAGLPLVTDSLAVGGKPLAMPAAAAAELSLLALAILVSRRTALSQGLALLAAGIGLIVSLAHVYGIPMLYSHPAIGSMSLPTAVLGTLAAMGVLFLRAESGLPAALLDPSEAGQELRRLAATALTPALLGWLLLTIGRRNPLDVGLLVLAFTAALFLYSFWSYTTLRRSQRERRMARAALTASELRYRRTFEQARIGIAHVSPEGRWLQVNQRLAEILGYEPQELLQKTYADVSHLEDLEVDVKQWELLRRGEISDYAVERRFETKNGEIVYADVRIAREEDEAGRLRHLIVVLQDVTARKLSDGTLRVYERALEATQNGILITDARRDDHPVVYANPAFLAITGYTAAEVIGRNCRFLNQRAREQAALEELRRAISEGRACSVLVRNHRKSGEAFWNQLSIAPIEDAAGKLSNFVGVMVDATERVDALAERERLLAQTQEARHDAETANRAKDRFLSIVSHELRSPLNAIVAWTSLLREEPGEDVRRAVRAIESSVSSQTRLVNDLLDASRIREGALQIEPVHIDLESLVQNAVTRLTPLASEKGVALEVETEGGAPAIADAERIEQVVRNLVDNALKFTPKGGHVHVRLSGSSDAWQLEVRDDGPGIPADALPNVFEEFWQGGRKGSHSVTGLGLGLFIVKYIVERHGGSVRISSEGAGRGTSVSVELPRPELTVSTASPDAPPDLKGIEVVVVDDDEATVQALCVALGRIGAVCHPARSVPEALRLIERGAPDILVSDIGLPDRSGLDLIRSVRALPAPTGSLLAIAVTGLVEPGEQKRIRRAGFDSYIGKPVEPGVVVNRIIQLRALAAAPTVPSRRVLLLSSTPRTAVELAALLRRKRHQVREVQDIAETLRRAADFQPHLILVWPSADLDVQVLAEGLQARGVSCAIVALVSGDAFEPRGFDCLLDLPLDPAELDRLLRFADDSRQ
jgi:PAS domain S-box-containing protein